MVHGLDVPDALLVARGGHHQNRLEGAAVGRPYGVHNLKELGVPILFGHPLRCDVAVSQKQSDPIDDNRQKRLFRSLVRQLATIRWGQTIPVLLFIAIIGYIKTILTANDIISVLCGISGIILKSYSQEPTSVHKNLNFPP